jgi:hypothetical protein
MINKYEIKNWGNPLDEKFFDPKLYVVRPVLPKKHDKKKAKTLKKN